MKKLLLFFFLAVLIAGGVPAAAQETKAPASVAAAPEEDLQQRVELATKMHQFRPVRDDIESTLSRVAQNLPQRDRQLFHDRMMAAIDLDKLEKLSIDSMAKTFTLDELQGMVDYYSSPRAQSIAAKMPIYQQMVQPEIGRMLDRALMDLRIGTPAQQPMTR